MRPSAASPCPSAVLQRSGWRRCVAPALAGAAFLVAVPVHAATLLVCREVDLAAPIMAPLTIPAGSLYRDDGRADDPVAAFSGDRWQLRLETIEPVVIPPLASCVRVRVRITSDSSIKSVAVGDNRRFVYAGSSLMLDAPEASEAVMTTRGRVLDSVP
ncbi:conserved protein of unknown function [Rhodovastum atsumiense]|uniref:Uncharacterized protein n=1 Tax=Rhodovastum atsumiense TaxID=504468 RepID=A0A5M6IQ64_9PROT|nr:hypothetical protein [Rhodovastum atsumiense]KAA5610412.1 hypothetical protein F1189_19500 [Rhodovastum atsumiense]CAH2602902.1 conserved protein of unknown function [Rhodovastum atsumiense]